MTPPLIKPDWPAPDRVLALCTTRQGGCSQPPFDSLNLGHHVDDEPEAVAANKALLASVLPADISMNWMQQVHGVGVIEAQTLETQLAREDLASTQGCGNYLEADAMWSRQPGAVCTVLSADCLPVLLCDQAAQVVAAAHGGWRGLLAGVLEATVTAMNVEPGALIAWLGPAIGPQAFAVGREVQSSFVAAAGRGMSSATKACFAPYEERPGHFYADLYQLARLRLRALGVNAIYGGELCTYSDPQRFFSYRRDGQTGRMASLIVLQ